MNSIPAKNLFDPNGTDLETKDRSELVASDRIEWSDAILSFSYARKQG